MAKATIVSRNMPWWNRLKSMYIYEYECYDGKNTFPLVFRYKKNNNGLEDKYAWVIPRVGDNIQYFGHVIKKIISRPVTETNNQTTKGNYKMKHSVNITGRSCGANPSIDQLEQGAIFKWPQGSRLYMKIQTPGSCSVNDVCVVKLDNGDIYYERANKPCMPVESGTEIILCVDVR